MLQDVRNTRSLLTDEAGADNPVSGSLFCKILFYYPGNRYRANYYLVTTLVLIQISTGQEQAPGLEGNCL